MAKRPRHSARLAAERLEDRTTPTVFGSPYGYGLSGSNGQSLSVGDVNGDGSPDVLASAFTALDLLLNDGAGNLGAPTPLSIGEGPSQLADLNGDGKLDIVISINDFASGFRVALGNGNGTFQAPLSFTISDTVRSIAVVDFNGDAKLDVVCSVLAGVQVSLNNGSASLFGTSTLYTPPGASPGGTGVDVGDFTGDGKPDIILAGVSTNKVYVFPNNGNGTFGTALSRSLGGSGNAVVVTTADFNRDGFLDAALTLNSGDTVAVVRGNGNGTFQTPTYISLTRAGALTSGDFDLDGNADLAVVSFIASEVAVYSGDGAGGFGAPVLVGSAINPNDLVAADLNADGTPDLITIATTSLSNVTIAPNRTPVVASFSISASTAEATKGVPFTVTVTAKDAGGATFTGFVGRVHFTSSDVAAGLPADTQFLAGDNGVKTFSVTLNTVSTRTVTVADVARPAIRATASLTVFRVNNNPIATTDTPSVAEDSTSALISVLANDSTAPDPGETLTVTGIAQPSHGAVTLISGVVRYTPVANYNGPDSFTYTISDGFVGPNGSGPGTATGTVNVTVTSVNDLPTATNDTLTLAEDSLATVVSVLGNDSILPDVGETLTVVSVAQPSHGIATVNAGIVRYTPTGNYFGPDAFTYTISDGNGGTATATINVTVTPVNDPPTANPDTLVVAEDSTATIVNVLSNDSGFPDVGETVVVTTVNQPAHGTTTFVSGVVRYTPVPDYNGPDAFTYSISDGNGGTATATVSVTVTPSNDPPTANSDALVVNEDSLPTAVGVLGNDTIAPDAGETLSVTSITQPSHGTTSLNNGVVSYAPAANYFGPDAFNYSISDGNGGTASATVNVTVNSVNDPPVANDDSLNVDEDDPATTVAVLDNDSFVPDAAETLAVVSVTPPAHGTVSFTSGAVQYRPTANYYGPDSFTYTISDGNGGTATATVNVVVDSVNDLPTATDDAATVAEDAPATAVVLLSNDSFAPDTGETLTVTSVTQPAHGTATLIAGVVRYQPAANYFGSDAFTYVVFDGNGGVATGTLNLTVTPVNDLPTANPDAIPVQESGGVALLDLLNNDSFSPDVGETLSLIAIAQPAHGTASLVSGVVRYTPAANYNGPDPFTYTLSDGNGGTATGNANLRVIPTPFTFLPFLIAEGTVGVTYSQSVAATGPVGPFTYSLTSGTLPHGLTLSAAGVLSGKPTESGIYNLTITATSSPTDSGPREYALEVAPAPVPLTLAGSSDGSATQFLPDAAGTYKLNSVANPFQGPATASRTAVGDVNGDGVPDTIFVTGPGVPIRLAVIDGSNNSRLVLPFDPFVGNFTGGGFVAAADFDGDGRAEIVVTADQGGGPRVAIFSLSGRDPVARANFFTVDSNFRGGARVDTGDVNGDGVPDLAVVAGYGGGPRVTLINGTRALTTNGFNPSDRLIGDFFAFEDALRNGIYIGIGDIDGDGRGDLVFGAGPGGSPRVLTISGKKLLQQGALAAIASPISNFLVANADGDRAGVRVAVTDADVDGRADIAVGTGDAQPSRVRVYLGKNFGGGEPEQFQDIHPFQDELLLTGVFVG